MEEIIERNEMTPKEKREPKRKAPKGRAWEKAVYYSAASVISVVFFLIFIIYLDIWPFGDRMMASYDLLAQIAPFAEHYFDVFSGNGSLFYSFSIAGGADVFGTLAYCFISPFSFIFLLGGAGRAVYMVPFVLLAKVACISLSATFFVKKFFPALSPVAVTILSVLYTYSGYFHVANTYINWLDFMIYLPLVAVAFSHFIETGKYLPFSLSIAACIYVCFSIACFSLLIIFLILFAYVHFAIDKNERRGTMAKICLSLVLAVSFALPLILPAFVSYIISGRNTGLFSNLMNDISASPLYSKFSYVLSDAVLVILGAYYLVVCDKRDGKNKFLLTATALIFAPVLIDEVCLLLNAGSYMSYSLRFGFLNSVLYLYLGGKAAERVDSDEYKVTYKREKWLISCIIAAFLLILTAAVFYCMQSIIDDGKGSFVFTKGIIKEDSLLWKMFEESDFANSFSSKFAHSLGGLEIICFLFGAIALSSVVVILCTKFKLMPVKVAAAVIVIFSLLQSCFFGYHTVAGDRNTMVTYDKIQLALDEVDKIEGGDRTQFRIKDYSNKISADAPLTLHYRAYTVFSSVIDSSNFTASEFFNYTGNRVNTIKSQSGNLFSDSLLGYKYAFTESESVSSNRDYWVKKGKFGGFNLYENKLVFPTAFKIPKGSYPTFGNRAEEYDALYNFLGGKGELTAKVSPTVTFIDGEVPYFRVTMTSSPQKGHTFVCADFPDDLTFSYSDGSIYDPENSKLSEGDFYYDHGYVRSSSTKTFAIKAEGMTEELIENMCMATILYDKVKELHDTAWANAVDAEFGRNTVTIDARSDGGESVFVNYFAIDGYGVKVNGKRAQLVENDLGFLVAELGDGENEVVFKYSSPYIKYIFIGIAVGAIIAAAVFLAFKYYGRLKHIFERAIYYAATVLSAFIFLLGFCFPVLVFLWKCIKGVFKL